MGQRRAACALKDLSACEGNFLEIILGLTAAVCWGVSDFAARFASRRIGAYRALMLMQLVGFLALSPYLVATGIFERAAAWGWRPWALALVAGALNTVSSLALYHSFEVGVMSIVAPISSAWPALTVTLALLSGERIAAFSAAGLAVTFLGVILTAVSFAPNSGGAAATRNIHHAHFSKSVGWACVSAVGFGLMFWWLGFHVVPIVGGAVSVWVIRVSTLCALALAAAPARETIRLPRGSVWWLLLAMGLLDTSAFVANNAGMGLGHVAIVSVLSSLYGAVTVLLSWTFLRDRLERTQWLGVFLLFVGIVLVSL